MNLKRTGCRGIPYIWGILVLLFGATIGYSQDANPPLQLIMRSEKVVFQFNDSISFSYELVNISKENVVVHVYHMTESYEDEQGRMNQLPDPGNVLGHNPQVTLKPGESLKGKTSWASVHFKPGKRSVKYTLGFLVRPNDGGVDVQL